MFSGVQNHGSLSGCLMDESGFSLVLVKCDVNATACRDILDNYMLPTLGQQFGDEPFPVPA